MTDTSHMTRSHRRCRPYGANHPPAPPAPRWGEPPAGSLDQVAASIGDAVERIIRSLDPSLDPRRGRQDTAPPRAWRGPDRWAEGGSRPHHRHHGDGCCHCGDDRTGGCCDACCDGCCHDVRCGPDPCQCTCCIGDADVVVYARVGETRVIPITLANPRARERTVQIDLGEFRTKGGGATTVVGRLLTPSEVVLDRCSESEIVVVVRVGQPGQPRPGDATPVDPGATKADLVRLARERGIDGAANMNKEQLIEALGRSDDDVPRLADVDDCHVAIADLRLQGCDHRPIRIAVAVLPRACARYEATCGCGCCC